MPFTHEDEITRVLMPAVEALLPHVTMTRARSVEYAIGADGRVNPDAVNLAGALLVHGQIDDTAYSTSSTVTYASGPSLNLQLPEGTWSVIHVGMTGGSNSSASSLDVRSVMQGIAATEVTRVGPSTARAPFFLYQQMTLSGNQTVTAQIQFKSDSAGTSQLFDSVQLLIAVKQ